MPNGTNGNQRLIDANALLERLKFKRKISELGLYRGLESAMAQVKKTPTVDAVEVVHGEWEMGLDEGDYEYGTCSVCGYNEYNAFGCLLPHNYCPNCGAKRDGDGNAK